MSDKIFLVGIANEGEKSFSIDEMKTWEISNFSFLSDFVYFKKDGVFHSMKRKDFKEIFNK
jgi:hypothetical protein